MSTLNTIIVFILLFFLSVFSYSQTRMISGHVLGSDTNSPIFGVEIQIKGSADGTITDLEGNFEIPVKNGDEIRFNSRGYKKQSIVINNQDSLIVRLESKNEEVALQTDIKEGEIQQSKPIENKDLQKNKSKKHNVVTGIVKAGDTGYGLPLVNVIKVNTKQLAVSDLAGEFEIEADSGSILQFSLEGYVKKHLMVYNNNEIEAMLIKLPTYPGGNEERSKFIASNLRNFTQDMMNWNEGVVEVQFSVNEDGSISDANVVKSLSPALDEVALKIVNKFPKWNPAYFKMAPIKISMTLPIAFRKEQ